jgi:Icc-related predicted phosphoesterase
MKNNLEDLAPPLQEALVSMGYTNISQLCRTLRDLSPEEVEWHLNSEEFTGNFGINILVANTLRLIQLHDLQIKPRLKKMVPTIKRRSNILYIHHRS